MKVAIIGAGIAGLSCAAGLETEGISATLFDKGKRPGGRLSSLRIGTMAWDYGAQYLEEGSGSFARQASLWREAGLLAEWPAGPEGALVGVPAMASLVEAECEKREVRFNAHIHRIDRSPNGWWVRGSGLSEGPFDGCAIAIPPEQAIPLLTLHDFAMARDMIGVHSQPCWTVMVAFREPVPGLPAFLRDIGPLAWAARNTSKPGRPGSECWTLQAGRDWSIANLEIDKDDVAARLLSAFADHLPSGLPETTFLKAHRWRFSQIADKRAQTAWNDLLALGICGDWCLDPRIEGAWRSGRILASRIIDSLAPCPETFAVSKDMTGKTIRPALRGAGNGIG